MASLAEIAAIGDSKAKAAAYSTFIDVAIARGDVAALKSTVDALLLESTPVTAARPLLKYLGEQIDQKLEDGLKAEEVCTHGLGRIAARGVDVFEEADFWLRWSLYRVYVGDEDFLRAASVLSQARLECSAFSDKDRASAYVRVAQNYFKGGDEVSADRYLKRAGESIYKADDAPLMMQWRSLQALIADSKRKFLEAASAYIQIVREASGMANDEELVTFLEKAAVCAVLAPAGPQRTRVLGVLVRDERIGQIKPVVGSMLTRVYHERLIPLADATAFEAGLQTHQRALTSDGTSIVAKALVEHNLLAASRLYSSISFVRLGELLGISPAAAEKTAARMIGEKRLAAALDQVGGYVDFALAPPPAPSSSTGASSQDASASAGSGGISSGATGRLLAWDGSIKEALAGLAEAADAIMQRHPQLKPF